MSAKVVGYNDVIQTKTRKVYNRASGVAEEQTWEAETSKAEAYFNLIVGNPLVSEATFEHNKAHGTVTLTIPDDDIPSTPQWEVEPIQVFKGLKTAPYFAVSGSVWGEIAAAESKMAKGLPYYAGDYTHTGQISRFWGLKQAGVEGYNDYAVQVTKISIYLEADDVSLVYENVNRVVPQASIGLPSWISNGLAKIPKCAEGSLPSTPYAVGGWQWLKKMPAVKTMADGAKIEVREAWIGADRWSKVFYNGEWDPTAS